MNRIAILTWISSLTLACLMTDASLFAQPATVPGDDVKLEEHQVFDVVMHSVPYTEPALKYRLFPRRSEMFDRNTVLFYHRAVRSMQAIDSGIQSNNQRRPDHKIPYLYETPDTYDEWVGSPLESMPVGEMREWLSRYEDTFEELDRARKSANCDWGLMPFPGEDVEWLEIMLDEVQLLRSVARMLAVAVRVAIADGDYELAAHHLGTGYKIANDLGNSEMLVSTLVGIAVSGIMTDQVRTWIQQPDAPNLFWPLVDLPDPVADSRQAIRSELEMLFGNSGFKTLDNAENMSMSPKAWRQALNDDIERMAKFYGLEGNVDSFVRFLILRAYPLSKNALISAGYDREKVEKMPVIQVVAIQQKSLVRILCDDWLKMLNLPHRERMEQQERIDQQYSGLSGVAGRSSTEELLPITAMLVPAVQQMLHAEARTARELAGLRTLEAIRAHVASTGDLPRNLDEINVVPLPLNPATNAPFEYRASDQGAELLDYGFRQFSWRRYLIRMDK